MLFSRQLPEFLLGRFELLVQMLIAGRQHIDLLHQLHCQLGVAATADRFREFVDTRVQAGDRLVALSNFLSRSRKFLPNCIALVLDAYKLVICFFFLAARALSPSATRLQRSICLLYLSIALRAVRPY
jgi:hypothetical protein